MGCRDRIKGEQAERILSGVDVGPLVHRVSPGKTPLKDLMEPSVSLKGDREMCLESGMDDYVTKPIKRDLVFEILGKWVLK